MSRVSALLRPATCVFITAKTHSRCSPLASVRGIRAEAGRLLTASAPEPVEPVEPAEPAEPEPAEPEEGEVVGVAGDWAEFEVDVAPCTVAADAPELLVDREEIPVPRAFERGSSEGPPGETNVTAKLDPLLDPATEPPDEPVLASSARVS